MKQILTLIALLVVTIGTAQETYNCPENFEVSDFTEYENVLEAYRDNLKNVRKWARENNREDIVWSTLRLEHWSSEIRRFIVKYKESHTDVVCKRLFITDAHKFQDYLSLGFLYQHQPDIAPIDHTKYKE